jgi:phosphatidate cytidylyltransferase
MSQPLNNVPPTKSPQSELYLRVTSALILVTIALFAIWQGGVLFQLFWGLTAIVCFFEWVSCSIKGFRPIQYIIAAFMVAAFTSQPFSFNNSLVAGTILSLAFAAFFSPPGQRIWAPTGLIYVTAFAFSLVFLRASPEFGIASVLWVCCIVWGSDVAAFFVGRSIGGPKLMPRISPKKTWSGFTGGILGGIFSCCFVLSIAGIAIKWQHLGLAAVISIAGAAGDLGESAFKRHFDVKDSGTSIPGHGGALDRADGLIIAAIMAVLIGILHHPDPATGLLKW